MRAVQLQGPGQFAIVERPDPVPGPTDLLIAPTAVGVCGTDVDVFEGTLAYFRTGQSAWPLIPGHEWVGDVLEVGRKVMGFSVGDRVVGETSIGCGRCRVCARGHYHRCPNRSETGFFGLDGAFATGMVYPASAAYRVPDALGDEAALIEPATIAAYGLRRAPSAGKHVLVLGAGPIGLFAVQLARVAGATRVDIASADRADRLEIARALGADRAVVLGRGDVASQVARLRETLGDDLPEVIIECSGSRSALAVAIAIAATAATISVIGLTGETTLPVDVDAVVLNDLSIVGVVGSPHVWPETIELLASGAVTAGPLITNRLPLDGYGDAIALVRDRAPGSIKVLLQPQA